MSKNNFRLLIIGSLVLATLSGLYDVLWPDPVTEKIMDYAYEIEPEIAGAKLVYVGVLAIVAVVFAFVSIVGLLLFKSWAKHLYLAGFILVIPMYPFIGVAVYSGISQLFYDLSMIMSGVILALIYFSPVSQYFRSKKFSKSS